MFSCSRLIFINYIGQFVHQTVDQRLSEIVINRIPIIGAVIAVSAISFSIGIVIHKRRKCDKSKHRQEGIKNA